MCANAAISFNPINVQTQIVSGAGIEDAGGGAREAEEFRLTK